MITVLVDASVYLDVTAKYPRFRFTPPSVWAKFTFPVVLTEEEVLGIKKDGHLNVQHYRYAKGLHRRLHDMANELGRPKLLEKLKHDPRLRALYARLPWEPITLSIKVHKDKGCRARYLAVKQALFTTYPGIPTKEQRPYYGTWYTLNTIKWMVQELEKVKECSPENRSENA